MDYSIKIGGQAGQGIQTIGDTLSRVFSRAGFNVFTHQDYESKVRGGHNFYQIRISEKPVMCSKEKVDIIVAFDHASIVQHEKELNETGIIIYDSSLIKKKYEKDNFIDIPFQKLALDKKIMSNSVATGAVLGILEMKLDILNEIIEEFFKKKGQDVVKSNIEAILAGYNYASKNCQKCSFKLPQISNPKLLVAGNDAIAAGAIVSGCKFYSAYPMTPSTGIMLYISSKAKEYGIIVEQAEDEISAINMALGASFAGVRSMTGTSGGGFALMSEGLSLAGMTETPIVIALAQRPGPATGFPTRTEQSDLLFALHTAHGEFPRIILAPGTPKQAFYLTNKAFDLAEKYQIPVIIMTDQYLADSQWTIERFDIALIKYKDYRLKGEAAEKLEKYKRHQFTNNGVTPLAVPGESKHLVVTDSDEHDEEGHIVEDAQMRVKMLDKRLFKKMPQIVSDIEPPAYYGKNNPEIVLTGWGSTFGLLKEAVDVLSDKVNAGMLHFSEIYPLPALGKLNYLKILKEAKTTFCIENNATGQFAKFFRSETGFEFYRNINKYDGRPFVLEQLLGEINDNLR